MPVFSDFDAARFLCENWQKGPHLIRNPWVEWANPLDPNELAGLACEPQIESRLVRNVGPDEWVLEQGPLDPGRFAGLGVSPWTLLVQAVDHHMPSVAALVEPFRFIPDWRIDDVMVSYAVDGGGVGPHFDQYDVFLVQGLGRRRWRIGPRCDETAPLLPHDGLRLLADFEPVEEWIVEPGDIIYVPPGFAHDGVAVGDDCMTYSVGFRAPSRGDLVSAWADHVLDTLSEDDRYSDPNLDVDANPGEISKAAISRLRDMVMGRLSDETDFALWFGQYITAPKDERLDWAPDKQMSPTELSDGATSPVWFERNPASRFSFFRQSAGSVDLFVDGIRYDCTGYAMSIAERLCRGSRFAVEAEELASKEVVGLVADLVNRGALALAEPD